MTHSPDPISPRIAVISLWAPDLPAAAHFYRDVIGLHLLPHPGPRVHFDLAGSYLVISQGTPAPAHDSPADRFPLLALAVPDLDAALQRLEAHAVLLPWGVESDSSSRWVMLSDPAGNLIELVEFYQQPDH